jgi:hypothetical protein
MQGLGNHPEIDEQDHRIIAARMVEYDKRQGPRVGDYIVFACETARRISYVWDFDDDPACQTTDGGSFHLGEAGISYSGSLYHGVPASTLTLTNERRPGAIWIFHRGFAMRDNGVHKRVPFRVYTCSSEAAVS